MDTRTRTDCILLCRYRCYGAGSKSCGPPRRTNGSERLSIAPDMEWPRESRDAGVTASKGFDGIAVECGPTDKLCAGNESTSGRRNVVLGPKVVLSVVLIEREERQVRMARQTRRRREAMRRKVKTSRRATGPERGVLARGEGRKEEEEGCCGVLLWEEGQREEERGGFGERASAETRCRLVC